MLGPPKPRRLDEPIADSLEDLVPRDNFYRHLEAKLDLGFVREWARERYAERGRPSIGPVVFFKLQFVMLFEGIRSERKLVETASLHLAHGWRLGYALDEPLPDHSSLTRVRSHHATEAYQKAMRKRQVWVEPLFTEAKLWHGLRRFRLRGLDNVNIEGLLVAAGQNLKRLLAATGWGRSHAPCGGLVALPKAARRLATVSG